jgi:hypothetical protein
MAGFFYFAEGGKQQGKIQDKSKKTQDTSQ